MAKKEIGDLLNTHMQKAKTPVNCNSKEHRSILNVQNLKEKNMVLFFLKFYTGS